MAPRRTPRAGGAADPTHRPVVIELPDEVPWQTDRFVFDRWEEAERLDRGNLIERDASGIDALGRSVHRGLNGSAVLLLRWRSRFGWPVTPGRSRTQRRMRHPAADALCELADGATIELGSARLEIDPLRAERTGPRQRAVGDVRVLLRWSRPFRARLSVAEWSHDRAALSLEIRRTPRLHWPRRWFMAAHDTLDVIDRRIGGVSSQPKTEPTGGVVGSPPAGSCCL